MPDKLSSYEKIEILLHEYDTLREELISKSTAYFNMMIQVCVVFAGFVGGAAVLSQINVINSGHLIVIVAVSVALLFASLAGAIAAHMYDIRRLSRRVREIELDINSRAGERLLVWESKYGWGDMFPWTKKPWKHGN